jgi:hypothetical protein
LFSARPALIDIGRRTYRPHSPTTSGLLVELFHGFQAEGIPMPFTMEDFQRQFFRKNFPKLSRKDREDILKSVPVEERLAGLPVDDLLAGLTEEQMRQLLERLSSTTPTPPRKPRRKK